MMNKKKNRSKRMFWARTQDEGVPVAAFSAAFLLETGLLEFPIGSSMNRLLKKYQLKGMGVQGLHIDTDRKIMTLFIEKAYLKPPKTMIVHEKCKLMVIELDISARLRHRMQDCACETVLDILLYSRSKFTTARRMGANSIKELDELMTKLGLYHLYNKTDHV